MKSDSNKNAMQNSLQNAAIHFNNQRINQNSVSSIGSLNSEMSQDSFQGMPHFSPAWFKMANATSNNTTIGSVGSNGLSVNSSINSNFSPLPQAWILSAQAANGNSISSTDKQRSTQSMMSYPSLPKEWLQQSGNSNNNTLNSTSSIQSMQANPSIQDSVKSISELSLASWSEKSGQGIPGFQKPPTKQTKPVYPTLPTDWVQKMAANHQNNSFPSPAAQIPQGVQFATHHNRGQNASMQPSQNEKPGQKRPLRMTNPMVVNSNLQQTTKQEFSPKNLGAAAQAMKTEQKADRVTERKLNVQVNAHGFVSSPNFPNSTNIFTRSPNPCVSGSTATQIESEQRSPETHVQAKTEGNARWNSWSHEEEVFLVAAVMDRFFRRGSLASATKGNGTGNTDCWEDIKSYYDRACAAWTNLEQNQGKPRLVTRSTSALCRHFKIMKVRASEGDVNGTKKGNFRGFLREWDTKYNRNYRLIPE